MTSKEKVKLAISESIDDALTIIKFLKGSLKKDQLENFSFAHKYQKWYSKALKIVEVSAKDRYQEFKSYYEIDPKRKTLGYGDYYIQDYFKGVVPSKHINPNFDAKHETLKNVYIQYTILTSIGDRADSVLSDIQTTLLTELQDTELETAKRLLKVNLRSSGVIAGVVLETSLSKILNNHSLTLSKKHPTLADYNEILKNNDIYDLIVWRKITYLSDLRNLCAHKKDSEPSKEQVEELISGVQWVTKNIF